MPSKIKDSPSKIDSPCNTVNGHSDKDEPKEMCEEIKEIAPVSEKNNDDISMSNNASYIEEDIDEGIGHSTKSLVEDMDTTKESDCKKSDSDNFKDQEFVFIHDTGFTVKIVASGVEPFDIQVIQF